MVLLRCHLTTLFHTALIMKLAVSHVPFTFPHTAPVRVLSLTCRGVLFAYGRTLWMIRNDADAAWVAARPSASTHLGQNKTSWLAAQPPDTNLLIVLGHSKKQPVTRHMIVVLHFAAFTTVHWPRWRRKQTQASKLDNFLLIWKVISSSYSNVL